MIRYYGLVQVLSSIMGYLALQQLPGQVDKFRGKSLAGMDRQGWSASSTELISLSVRRFTEAGPSKAVEHHLRQLLIACRWCQPMHRC